MNVSEAIRQLSRRLAFNLRNLRLFGIELKPAVWLGRNFAVEQNSNLNSAYNRSSQATANEFSWNAKPNLQYELMSLTVDTQTGPATSNIRWSVMNACSAGD